MDSQIDVVVPSYNEIQNLPRLLAGYQTTASLNPNIGNLVIFDNGSTTISLDYFNENHVHGLVIAKTYKNLGYGGGAKSAILNAPSPLVCLIPAGNQYDWDDISLLINLHIANQKLSVFPIMTKGNRTKRRDPHIIRIMSDTYSAIVRILFGLKVKDVNGLPKIFDKSKMDGNFEDMPSDATFDAILMSKWAYSGNHFIEYPVSYLNRKFGQPSWAQGKFKIGFRMAISLVSYRWGRE